jgi:hypothetical protein
LEGELEAKETADGEEKGVQEKRRKKGRTSGRKIDYINHSRPEITGD